MSAGWGRCCGCCCGEVDQRTVNSVGIGLWPMFYWLRRGGRNALRLPRLRIGGRTVCAPATALHRKPAIFRIYAIYAISAKGIKGEQNRHGGRSPFNPSGKAGYLRFSLFAFRCALRAPSCSSAFSGSGSWCRPAWSRCGPGSCRCRRPRRRWRRQPHGSRCRCGTQ